MDKRAVRVIRGLGLVVLAGVLAACGGAATGFPPVVTGFKAQVLQYGRTAVLYAGGNDLRSSMTVETSGICSNPSLASSSTSSLLLINCSVTAVGDFTLTLKASNGDVVYQTSLSVPQPQVQLSTNLGNIVLELKPAAAQSTVNNFLNYVHSGYYSNTLFHRVIPGFVVQGGGYTSGMALKAGQGNPIVLESNNGLSNLRGTVAMARRSDPNYDSATSEFYINLVDNTALDYRSSTSPGYAVFGTVVSGMDVVDAMASQATGTVGMFANVPLSDVTINSAQQIQ